MFSHARLAVMADRAVQSNIYNKDYNVLYYYDRCNVSSKTNVDILNLM